MCVIVYKPRNIEIKESVIDSCFTENPNGAGFTLIRDRNDFITRKGFMNVDELKTALNEFGDLKQYSLVLHFRIMTSGIVNPVNCHPYPITNKQNMFTQTEFPNTPVIYHNGILFSKLTSWTNEIDEYSDSFLLARDILSRSNKTGIQNILSMIANTTTNKFAYVNSHGTVYIFGTFQKHDECLFSNLYWNEPKTPRVWGGTWDYEYWTKPKPITKPNPIPKTSKTDSRCIKCNQFLWTWERESGVCAECESRIYKPKLQKSIISIPDNSKTCISCGVYLNKHEHVYCDDCLEWYTNPNRKPR